MNIAGVILAAGSSSRLGRPKQTVEIDGETLIERSVRIAQQADLYPVFVVIATNSKFRDHLQQQGIQIVLNQDAAEGMASSIRHGVKAAQAHKSEGVVLIACDQPTLTSDHLRQLCADPESSCGSRYAGKVGIPAYFPASIFDNLLTLQGDQGARNLLLTAHYVHAENLGYDIDTEADIAQLSEKINCTP